MNTRCRLLVLLLLGLGLVRLGPGQQTRAGAPRSPAPVLPARLAGHPGITRPLGPSERALDRRPGVDLQQRRYGTTRVALVSTTGIKELHPPAVCLSATGHEVVFRVEQQSPEGCLVALTVHSGEAGLATFYHTYFSGQAPATCSYWGRAAQTIWARLWGEPGRWSTVQVLDRDPRRARAAIIEALHKLRTTNTNHRKERDRS